MNEWVRSDAFLYTTAMYLTSFPTAKCCHPSSMLCTQKVNNCLKQVNQKWMEEKQTVHLVKRKKTTSTTTISTSVTLHFSCNTEWCAEKKLHFSVLSRSIFSCDLSCTLHTTCQFVSSPALGASLGMLYILSVYCIHWNNSSLNSHYHCNELVRTMNSVEKINILNKKWKWKWNATMHNDWDYFSSFVRVV